MLASGLLMQHSCWYQFACSLLVTCSLQHLQTCQSFVQDALQQQQQQQQHLQDWETAPQQLLQLLLQVPDHQGLQQLEVSDWQMQATGRSGVCSSAVLAASAACLVAWVQQPTNSSWCAQVEQWCCLGLG
jgi:hypothetical protein